MALVAAWRRGSAILTRASLARGLASVVNKDGLNDPRNLRNIGISAHIDSGKTTLTERILFYTGRINAIHEVRGRDGVGAKMDSMELEREKGITIQSAATFTRWKDTNVNIIDTPGHVDFTVEVERALRVLDGAVLVLCSVGGVQSQSVTVDRQMKRYKVPRVAFINKLDRVGASPFRVIDELREKLHLNASPVQVPIGIESSLIGVVDIIEGRALYNKGDDGEVIEEGPVPDDLADAVAEKRQELIERLAEVDEEIGELFLLEETPSVEQLKSAIRRCTLANTFVPVFMGSAFKNRGVQPLLDGVVEYLPTPLDMKYNYLDANDDEKEKPLSCDANEKAVALAFKLEESRFGQLTYLRVYQGQLRRGNFLRNSSSGKRIKVARLVRMHSDEMEEVEAVGPGEICALFGVECSSGDTFCDGDTPARDFNPTLMTMFVPSPVVSLAIKPKDRGQGEKFSKALGRFQREDPTFRVSVDEENKETIIAGMGELHLEVYVERMKREYDCECVVGAPQVNYREAITQRADFDYTHKKQSGGAGQFGRIMGYVEPVPLSELPEGKTWEFRNRIVGNAIAPEYLSAVEKGFEEALQEGTLVGQPVQGLRVVVEDGASHSVDSSEMAFKLTARGAFRSVYPKAAPIVLEPIMAVEVECPDDLQGPVVSGINQRRGVIQDTFARDGVATVRADVPLSEMFGYSNALRSSTQAKGEFTMEFKANERMPQSEQARVVKEYAEEKAAAKK